MLSFETDSSQWVAVFNKALAGLQRNVKQVAGYGDLLVEGATYDGVWLESGPYEGLLYSAIDPVVAMNQHRLFFTMQQSDGYLPYALRNPQGPQYGQIQMVTPIAATAYELYLQNNNRSFLEEAYEACAKWDHWLRRYRDTRGFGLCEAFCEFDTGHDNSPRWAGLPRRCPNRDARICPQVGGLPRIAPDLSATLYGGRIALGKMADALGRPQEAIRWRCDAARTREMLLACCFDPEALCFFDLDKNDQWVRIRGDVLTRVLSEAVVVPELFEKIYQRHIINPQAFWTPYPLPSISTQDPAFIHDYPDNSWGGPSQSLTALRAPRWFERYRKSIDLRGLMRRWLDVLLQQRVFCQQIDPWTGRFSPGDNDYSPTMLLAISFIQRLYGLWIEGDALWWHCSIAPGATWSRCRVNNAELNCELRNNQINSELRVDDQSVACIKGVCRVVTDRNGQIQKLVGIHQSPALVRVQTTSRGWSDFNLIPNQIIKLT